MLTKKVKFLSFAIMWMLLCASSAHATGMGFTDFYDIQNWNASGTGTEGILAPSGSATDAATFTYDNNRSGFDGSWSFLTTAEETGVVNFDWKWTGLHSWYKADGDLYFRSGSSNIFLGDVNGSYFNIGGSFSGTVNAGEQFGFFITGSNYDRSRIIRGALEITNFSAPGSPAPAPEPATILLLGFGLIGLAGTGRRKIR